MDTDVGIKISPGVSGLLRSGSHRVVHGRVSSASVLGLAVASWLLEWDVCRGGASVSCTGKSR